MISISSNKLKHFSKIILMFLFLYILGFAVLKAATYYQTLKKKEALTLTLQEKKTEFVYLKNEVKKVKEDTQKVKDSYISKDDLAKKISTIFERMSILDYNLRYLDSKQMCVDRYILIAQLTAQSEMGVKAGESILSYLGEVKKSDTEESLYYINYIAKPKVKE